MARAFVGVGSNIDPHRHILLALEEIRAFARPVATSRFYTTQPIGRPEQASYANGAWLIETDLGVRELRAALRAVETRLGRVRGGDCYAARTIDLDILLFDELAIVDAELRIPDPHILERPFLAASLLDIEPDLVYPGSGTMLESLIRIDRSTLVVDERLTHEIERSLTGERKES